MPDNATIQGIVGGLRSADPGEREEAAKALGELAKRGLSPDEGHYALRAAAEPFPARRWDFQDSAWDLLVAVVAKPRPEYVPLVVELFPRYHPKVRQQALRLLAELDEREAAVAYMDLLRRHAKSGEVPELIVGPLSRRPRHPEIFFPELLDYTGVPHLAVTVCSLCLAFCRAGLLDAATLLPRLPQVLAVYAERRDKLFPAQRLGDIAWMWEDEYLPPRYEADELLDLLGFFPARAAEEELRRALGYRDPLLKSFAVLSLLRLGQPVAPDQIEAVAASAEVRNRLFDCLAELGKLALFPDRFRTQEALAESDMVHWLTFPTELARVPDEIELMAVVPIDTGTPDGFLDSYVFRFRTHPPHWAAKDGWMAGVAGPFLRDDAPSTRSYGGTFSAFAPWDSQTPEGHAGQVEEILGSWREHHARKNAGS